MVKYIVRGFLNDMAAGFVLVNVHDLLTMLYKVTTEKRVIPTGIDLLSFERA